MTIELRVRPVDWDLDLNLDLRPVDFDLALNLRLMDMDLDLRPLDLDLKISELEDLDLDSDLEEEDMDLDLPPWDLTTSPHITDAFSIKFTTFPPNVVRIGQMINKRQQFSKYQKVTSAILKFSHCAFFYMTDAF